MTKKKYDSTVARIAGNILSGMVSGLTFEDDQIEWSAETAVRLARAIIAETERTEPAEGPQEGTK